MIGRSKMNERLPDMVTSGLLVNISVLPKKKCKNENKA